MGQEEVGYDCHLNLPSCLPYVFSQKGYTTEITSKAPRTNARALVQYRVAVSLPSILDLVCGESTRQI